MSYNLNFPVQNDEVFQLQLEPSQMLFVLGANGTGKSSLMQRFAQQNFGKTRKIAAHRQTWMNTDALDMTPSTKIQMEQNIQNEDRNEVSRYRDQYAAQKASMTIYEIIDAENVRARKIAAAVDSDDMDAAKETARDEAPISVINELLRQSNIPVTITIRQNERLMASKNGGPEYSLPNSRTGSATHCLLPAAYLLRQGREQPGACGEERHRPQAHGSAGELHRAFPLAPGTLRPGTNTSDTPRTLNPAFVEALREVLKLSR